MILMTGEYDPDGKLCTRVMTGEGSFLVDRPPLHVLNDTLTYIGFDLKGAANGAKKVLGKKIKRPIIANPYLGICLFPDKSPSKADCIWFNPEHIINIRAAGSQTEVDLSNGHSIIVYCKLASFNQKIETANKLKRLTSERGHNPGPMIFLLEQPKKSRFSKGKNGKYNFSELEKEEKDKNELNHD